jgi:hypothetical protein
MSAPTVEITLALIEKGASDSGGWTRAQAKLLGLKWPFKKGWKHRVIGTRISQRDADEFLSLRNTSKAQQNRLQQESGIIHRAHPNDKDGRIRELEEEVLHWQRRYNEVVRELEEGRELDSEFHDITASR